ncbi:MAG: hypothetical protein ABFS10_12180 [Bacteroidota bacterium]
MRHVSKTFGGWIAVLILIASPALPQSLFESSRTSTHEKLVSNNFSPGGFIRSVAYVANRPETDSKYLQSAYVQVGLLLDAKAGQWSTAKAEVRLKYGTEFDQAVSRMEIREATIDLRAGPAELTLGKLITPWGKGTMFNPVDKITPLDPTIRSPEQDDMLLGTWGVQGRIHLGNAMKLTATWKPVYRSSKLLIDPIPMPEYVNFLEPDHPGTELKEGSYGLNWDIYTGPMDLSLYWFEGYHHWPGIGYDSLMIDPITMEPLALNLVERAYRIRMAGLDLSVPLGSWIFRAEGGWQQTLESHETAEYLPFPELSYTAEVERSGRHFGLLAGYYGKYIIDYAPSLAEPSLLHIRAFNRLYNYQMDQFYHTVFLVGSLSLWHDQVEIGLPLIHHLTTGEWTILPGISYLPTDGLKITAGFSGLYGSENSLYDMVGPVLNAGYLSVKLSF